MQHATWKRLAVCAAVLAAPGRALAGGLAVVSVEPPPHASNRLVSSSITVSFDQPVDPASITSDSFWAFGKWSGTAQGAYVFSNNNQTVTLDPSSPFFYGEPVMVILSHEIQTPGGDALRSAGYSWQFWTAAAPAALQLATLDTMSTRTTQSQATRSYGGIATDLDNDGWADLTIVNEVSADLRVFLNRADFTGLFEDFLRPTFPVNTQASPSEPSDFNRDGFADIVVVNIATASVSILLGLGDGRYGPQQQITVGLMPRGVAVLDADGDGDTDVVNTNWGSDNMSILLNDGSGVFGAPVFFEGGGNGERALAAADMNDDLILDLVVSALNSQTIVVHTGDGDGTFTARGSQGAGGQTWMLVCGDLDRNGTEDVCGVNSNTNTGLILLGNGAGGLGAPQTYATDSFPLGTDLGDLDGDGDLDWVTSSFNGDWRVFTNDGDGTYTFLQELPSPQAASCALPVDIDNDGDLDLALVDELADVVILVQNSGLGIPGDTDGDGIIDITDLLSVLGLWGACPAPCPPFCAADVNRDCAVDVEDLLIVLGNWT